MELFFAVILGTLFGFALNRTGATNPENIINMLRLTDLRLMKAILFAIGLASIALFTCLAIGLVDPSHLSIKTSYIGVIVGGGLLGIGFAIAGYCPGTGLAAFATGRKDALVFVIGGLVGAFFYTLLYQWLVDHTPLFTPIAGGDVALVQTGNAKYQSLINFTDDSVLGIGVGVVFVILAIALPQKIITNKHV